MATALRYRAPAPVLFVIGAVSMYVGAALAVGLFTVLAPAAVAVLRMLGAAAVLLAWRRPPAAAWRGARLLRAAAFGLATAGMNIAFYEAIARLPLGTAVAVGVLSSVVPYVLDQIVLRRVGQARFAVLLALLPATATIVGLIALRQVPSPLEAVGIAAVIGAVALRSRDGDPAEPLG